MRCQTRFMDIKFRDGNDRSVNLLHIRDWNLPKEVCNHHTQFICMIVGDASEIPEEQISSLAAQLIQSGMVYLCAWGPDCSRVHDLTDLILVDQELESGNEIPVMTTWHIHESLDDALWFALNSACPAEEYETACSSLIILVVNNDAWMTHIGRRLSNMEQFNADVT